MYLVELISYTCSVTFIRVHGQSFHITRVRKIKSVNLNILGREISGRLAIIEGNEIKISGQRLTAGMNVVKL
jgi:hypothetical protein